MQLIEKNVVTLKNVLIRQVNLVDYLKQHVFPIVKHKRYDIEKIDRMLDQQSMVCPWHEETQGSFRVYRRHHNLGFEYFDCYCFGCRSGGLIINVHQKTQAMYFNNKMSYLQTLESLAELYNIKYEPLFIDETNSVKKIQNTNIQLEDILRELNKGTKAVGVDEAVIPHYGKYTNLIETQLRYFKETDFNQYLEMALELDYLMSLGLQPSELSLELETIYYRNKICLDEVKQK